MTHSPSPSSPSRRELNNEQVEENLDPLPAYVRTAPLRATAPLSPYAYRTLSCTAHPAWQAHGDRSFLLYAARFHLVYDHSLPDPDPPTPGPLTDAFRKLFQHRPGGPL